MGLDLEILFISEEDGRESLVDLTRTLCDMAQRGKISVDDVTQDLVDAEVSGMYPALTHHCARRGGMLTSLKNIGTLMTEPDLLIVFTPMIVLKGYPPWQIRLTELL